VAALNVSINMAGGTREANGEWSVTGTRGRIMVRHQWCIKMATGNGQANGTWQPPWYHLQSGGWRTSTDYSTQTVKNTATLQNITVSTNLGSSFLDWVPFWHSLMNCRNCHGIYILDISFSECVNT